MIPKRIHYCWFGRNPLPELAERCIASWKEMLPDYEIVRWDEDSFDIESNQYVKEAYEAKKYAFVSDYVRLYAMCTQGGIYMDTDVQVVRSLDPYLQHQAFSGFESVHSIPTGIMACEKDFPGFCDLLSWYDDKHFVNEDGSYNATTNVVTITNYYLDRGLVRDNTKQTLEGFTVYPNIVFCPYKHEIGSRDFKRDTVTIHHKYGSWLTDKDRAARGNFKQRVKSFAKKAVFTILGKKRMDTLLLSKLEHQKNTDGYEIS